MAGCSCAFVACGMAHEAGRDWLIGEQTAQRHRRQARAAIDAKDVQRALQHNADELNEEMKVGACFVLYTHKHTALPH